MTPDSATPLRILTRGPVSEADRAYASEKVTAVARLAPRTVLDVHVELRREANPSLERPAIAKATLAVGGRSVRAHVAARGMREAIDLLDARLRERLGELAGRERAHIHRGAVPHSGEWRHGDQTSHRPEFRPRSAEKGEIRRVKRVSPDRLTPQQAALEMGARSYEFFLFADATSEADSLLYRGADGRLVLVTQVAGDPGPFAVDRSVPAPMAVEDAAARLDAGTDHFVFFSEAASGRGAVLYRRYDGHYGLLTSGQGDEGRET